MVTKTTKADEQQYLRTVEMFEAIVASQPSDYQSLAILREAYDKLGRTDEARDTAFKLARALAQGNQLGEAASECRLLLEQNPDHADAAKLLAAIEQAQAQGNQLSQESGGSRDQDTQHNIPASEVTTGDPATPLPLPKSGDLDHSGTDAFVKVLVAEKILTNQVKGPLLKKLAERLPESIQAGATLTLFQLIVEEQVAQRDDLLSLIVSKSAKPYLPLSDYDVDRDIAFLLPRQLCFERCIIPFDLIGRSVLVATTNPFDATTMKLVADTLDYSVFWYVSPPDEILKALCAMHGIDTKKPKRGGGKAS